MDGAAEEGRGEQNGGRGWAPLELTRIVVELDVFKAVWVPVRSNN